MWLSCAALSARLRSPLASSLLRCSSIYQQTGRGLVTSVASPNFFSRSTSIRQCSSLPFRAAVAYARWTPIRCYATEPSGSGNGAAGKSRTPGGGGSGSGKWNARNERAASQRERSRSLMLYLCSMGLAMFALTFASAPLYSVFCRVTGLGGSSRLAKLSESAQREAEAKMSEMRPLKRQIRVRFEADVDSTAYWQFAPVVREVSVHLGEPTLIFFTATNPTDADAIGIATYTILPYEAAQHFIKIQCFCFDEQRIGAHETVQLPVLFYVDAAYDTDPRLEFVDDIVLSYTFLESKDAEELLAAQPHMYPASHAPLAPPSADAVTVAEAVTADANAVADAVTAADAVTVAEAVTDANAVTADAVTVAEAITAADAVNVAEAVTAAEAVAAARQVNAEADAQVQPIIVQQTEVGAAQ